MPALKTKYILILFSLAVFFVPELFPAEGQNENVMQRGDPYLIGRSDQVLITVFQQPDMSTLARVSADGTILVPLIGAVQVGGLTEKDASETIEAALVEAGVIRNPSVTVSVSEFRSQRVSVLGYVTRPGEYFLNRPTSVGDLLALVGGVTADASDLLVFIDYNQTDNSFDRREIIIDDLLRSEEEFTSIYVGDGDSLYVPKAEIFYIYGAVRVAGQFRIVPGMTVEQALVIAGGVTEAGSRNGIRRRGQDNRGRSKLIDVDLDSLVEAGDVFFVPESLF